MDENKQMPKEPTKKEKAEQAGKDVAEVAAKGAANYLGGPVGGAIANKVTQTKMGQKALNAAGKTLAKNPISKNTLSKAQPAIQNAKPMLNAAAGGLGGNAGGAANAAKGATGAVQNANSLSNSTNNSSNPSTSSSSAKNNSGFGSSKSGLFSSSLNSSEQTGTASGDFIGGLKKSKKIIGILIAVMPIIFPLFLVLLVAFIIMGQIMAVVENIQEIAIKVDTGIEKYVNFFQGDGWATNEESFFNQLNEEYKRFPFTGGDSLDVPLIASTIHYSVITDLEQYEEKELEKSEENSNLFDMLQKGMVEAKQTSYFYDVAKEKLGTTNTLWPGQKRLMGHIVKTEVTMDKFKDVGTGLTKWAEFFTLVNNTISDTANDAYYESALAYINPITSIPSFIEAYRQMESFKYQTGDAFAGTKYDLENLLYELDEFKDMLNEAYKSATGLKTDENGNYKTDENGWFPAPVVKRTMNYGYDQFKQMKQDLLGMKAILSKNDVDYKSDSDVLEYAKNSSNTELKKLYDSYMKNEQTYKYSYTHYLEKVYIPFTYFYDREAPANEVARIIDEIYDQRDYYYYLIGEQTDVIGGCGYTYSGEPVSVDINVDMITNMYVNVLEYGEKSRTSTNIAETVSLKEYVTGVLYRELGATVHDSEEYLKANIIAIKSFTVGRPRVMGDPIKNEGDKYYLNMRNNTNDQVYCSLTKGCLDAPSNAKPAPSQELVDYISKLYDEVANEFLYDSASGNFTGSYRDKASTCAAAGATGHCMGQKESKKMGEDGETWETILGTFYEESIGIVDITTSKLSTSVVTCIAPGLQLGHSGYQIRTAAPTSGNQYFTPPWNGSTLGQCAWYAKGRALEIVDTVNASQEKKDLAIETIKQIYANGNQWYHPKLIEVFAHSTDYTMPRPGAIVSYDWVSPDEKGNRYGHVAIVEKVEGDLVYVSDGWNSCGGAYGQASWNCIGFGYRALTIEQMKNMGRPDRYKFIGYVYLLD